MSYFSRELKPRIENELQYRESGVLFDIIDVECVPHIIYYRDYPYKKQFYEYYCIVEERSRRGHSNVYYQVTHDTVTNDLYIFRIGKL